MDAVCLEMVTGGRKVPRERVEVLVCELSRRRVWRSVRALAPARTVQGCLSGTTCVIGVRGAGRAADLREYGVCACVRVPPRTPRALCM